MRVNGDVLTAISIVSVLMGAHDEETSFSSHPAERVSMSIVFLRYCSCVLSVNQLPQGCADFFMTLLGNDQPVNLLSQNF